MALIESVWNDLVGQTNPSIKFYPVEVAKMGKSSALWFDGVPPSAGENERSLRQQTCQACTLYSKSEGDFNGRDLKQIIIDDRQCTGIYLHTDDYIIFRREWWLQAVAPRGTFSHPDPRAICATLKARP